MTLDLYGENIFRLFQDNAGASYATPRPNRKPRFWWTSPDRR